MSAHCQRPVWPGIEALLLERPRSTSPKMYTRYFCLPVPTGEPPPPTPPASAALLACNISSQAAL